MDKNQNQAGSEKGQDKPAEQSRETRRASRSLKLSQSYVHGGQFYHPHDEEGKVRVGDVVTDVEDLPENVVKDLSDREKALEDQRKREKDEPATFETSNAVSPADTPNKKDGSATAVAGAAKAGGPDLTQNKPEGADDAKSNDNLVTAALAPKPKEGGKDAGKQSGNK